ncbi:MAG: transposase [Clostridia bacterium]|nr:transposase [Clostridia bacterium]
MTKIIICCICENKGVAIHAAQACPDHIHILLHSAVARGAHFST